MVLSHLIPFTKRNIYFLKHLPPPKKTKHNDFLLNPPFSKTMKLKLPGLPYGDGAASVCEALKCKTCGWTVSWRLVNLPYPPKRTPHPPEIRPYKGLTVHHWFGHYVDGSLKLLLCCFTYS